jgi:hypothetical protein
MEETLGYVHVWCLSCWRDGVCSDLMLLFPGMDVHSRLDVSGFYDCFVLAYAPAGERKQFLDRLVVCSSGEILYDWLPLR